MSGTVYFIESGPGGPVKIGYTSDTPQSRIRVMQTGNPSRLRLLASMEGTEADEAELHERFEDARIRGEWFHPTKMLLAVIAEAAASFPDAIPQEKPVSSAEKLIKALGREAIMDAVGVSSQAVSNAKARGQFHGLWFGRMAELAEKRGKSISRDAFMWREPDKATA